MEWVGREGVIWESGGKGRRKGVKKGSLRVQIEEWQGGEEREDDVTGGK